MLSRQPRRARRRADLADLATIALQLEADADAAGWDAPAAIVQIVADRMITRPITPPRCPIDELVELAVHDDCSAVGLVAEAVAHDLDSSAPPDPCQGGFDARTVTTARTAVVVDRDGRAASVLRRRGRAPAVMAPWPEGTSGGRVHDLCRLALGLATPPPSTSPVRLWATVWLDRLVTAGCSDADAVSTWPDAASHHPAVDALTPDGLVGAIMSIHDLERLGLVLGSLYTWEDLRNSCAAGDLDITGLRPRWAAHLDEGAFSRWVLGGFPAIRDLFEVVSSVLPRPVADGIAEALLGWRVVLNGTEA